MAKQLIKFPSGEVMCEADLHLPETEKPAVVVMAQGYACERQFGTQSIIAGLVEKGLAVFCFDYRGFGGSDTVPGEQRQLVDPEKQLEDWHAALAFVNGLQEIDNARIGIWGSSFAGGHVLSVGGSDWINRFNLKAIVSQIPHCDSRTAFKHVGFKVAMKGAYNGIKGAILEKFGKHYTVPVLGRPEDEGFAVLKFAGWYEDYMKIAEGSKTWVNAIPAISLLRVGTYNPIDFAKNINAPVLMVYGSDDAGIPLDDVRRTIALTKQVESFEFPGDHFDAYDGGKCIDDIVARETEFFVKHLV